MLIQQTLTKLHSLKLSGMAQGFEEQLSNAAAHSLAFEDRFAMLVDHEATHRENQRLRRLLKTAKLKVAACVEDIDYRHNRGLDKSMMASLLTCQWIERGLNNLTKVTCVVLQGMLFPNPGKPILFNTSKSIDRLAATAICPVEVEDRCICRVWK
jgi:hypothetical protein